MDEADYAQIKIEGMLAELVLKTKSAISGAGALDGICEDCGDRIPVARLEAAPWATRCVECQELYEGQGFRG
jgi:phage/conjugal plasmid C-4 type zinc finger TraR family protein